MEFKSYEHKSAGKLLGMTKIRHLWKLKAQGTYYEIKVAESLISGKFVVMVQNDIVFNEKVDSAAKKRGVSVSADGLDLMFKNAAKGLDLFVNMVKFEAGSKGKATDDDFEEFESNSRPVKAVGGGGKSDAKNNDHMGSSWAQFDALEDSDEEGGFDNFGSKPIKENKDAFGGGKDAFGGGASKDAFGGGFGGSASKPGAFGAKPAEQKGGFNIAFKPGGKAAPTPTKSSNKDPFGAADDDGWGNQASSKHGGGAGGWGAIGGGDDDDDDDFAKFDAQPSAPQRPNLLPNFPSKNPVSNQPKQGGGFGFDAGKGQSSSGDAFGFGAPAKQAQPARGSGFDAFGGPASGQSGNKAFGQPAQQQKTDPFGGFNKPAQQADPFGGFGAAPAQNRPAQPQAPAQGGANMWSNFQAKPQGQAQANPFGGAPNQQQGFNQGWGNNQQQQRPPQQPAPQQQQQQRPAQGANMWSNFQPNQGFGGQQPQQAQQQRPQQQSPQQPQQRPPQQQGWTGQPQQPAQQGWAAPQQQQPPQQQQQQQWGTPQQPAQQNPFGGAPQQGFANQNQGQPPQQQQRPAQPPQQQQPQSPVQPMQMQAAAQPPAQPQQQPPAQQQPPSPAPQVDAFGAAGGNWDAGFGGQPQQEVHAAAEAQPTIEQNPFNASGQDAHQGGEQQQHHEGGEMYPKPDLSAFGGADFGNFGAPAGGDQHPPAADGGNPFDGGHPGGDPFAGHAANPDPFGNAAAQQGLNEQMANLNFNAGPDAAQAPPS